MTKVFNGSNHGICSTRITRLGMGMHKPNICSCGKLAQGIQRSVNTSGISGSYMSAITISMDMDMLPVLACAESHLHELEHLLSSRPGPQPCSWQGMLHPASQPRRASAPLFLHRLPERRHSERSRSMQR